MKYYFFSLLALFAMMISLVSCNKSHGLPEEPDKYDWGMYLDVVEDNNSTGKSPLNNWLKPRVDELNKKYSGTSTDISQPNAIKDSAIEALNKLKDEYEAYIKSCDFDGGKGAEYNVEFYIYKNNTTLFTQSENFVAQKKLSSVTYTRTIALKVADMFSTSDTYTATFEIPLEDTELKYGPYTITFDIANSNIYHRANSLAFEGPMYLTAATYDPSTSKVTYTMQFEKKSAEAYKGQHYIKTPIAVTRDSRTDNFNMIVNVDIE